MSQLVKNVIPKTGQQVTRLGFGSYRASQPVHAEALKRALEGGVNIIDTGNNFENGASETLIGNTLQSMKLSRESITLVSKSGYLTAKDIQTLDQKDYVQLNEKSFHSVSPRVIESQIESSLERLKIKKLDIFMINSPERMLMSKNRRYTSSQLYKDLSDSFKYLDSLVMNGTIGGYGVCSNTMAFPTAADHVSLKSVLESCANPSNFLAIQVPFNLYEREAIVSDNKSVAEIAKEKDIYVMTNRPLNAIANGQIRVLVNHELGADGKAPAEHEIMSKMQTSFEKVARLESDVMSELPIEEEALTAKFVWGQVLSENLARLAQNHFATRHYLTQQVLPVLDKDLKELRDYATQLDTEEEVAAYEHWIENYRECVHNLSHDIVNYAYIDTLRKNNELDRILSALCPSLNTMPQDAYSPISIKALRFMLSHQQVGTVFHGMRDPLYVKDALFAAQQEPINQEDIDDVWTCPIFN
ncbi:NADP-dependent oxidoreductase domain-containing protein [Gilbertella persicaria]|uniref:NADP-dependent oxidoreductase domain-containing protein n=1 Tax=Gilbertella persicaria TaxID=101096 RepID=UPI00221FE304|nr:NADP-dependent oxidoreductase domain-containing protein [Gilbertella persicaria]KAI8095029.1 NADP-dependent oxidoreductase domain-containing protein [Gilbertella persicaria]